MIPTAIFWDASNSDSLPTPFSLSTLKLLLKTLTGQSSTTSSFRIYFTGLNLDSSEVEENDFKRMLKRKMVDLTVYNSAEPINIERLVSCDFFTFILDNAPQPTLTILIVPNPSAFYYSIHSLKSRGHKVVLIVENEDEKGVQIADLILCWSDVMKSGEYEREGLEALLERNGWEGLGLGDEEVDGLDYAESMYESISTLALGESFLDTQSILDHSTSFTRDSLPLPNGINEEGSQFSEHSYDERESCPFETTHHSRDQNAGWIDSHQSEAPTSPVPSSHGFIETGTNEDSEEAPEEWEDWCSDVSRDRRLSASELERPTTPRPSTSRQEVQSSARILGSGFIDRITGEGWSSDAYEIDNSPSEFPALPAPSPFVSGKIGGNQRSWAQAIKETPSRPFSGTILPSGTLVPSRATSIKEVKTYERLPSIFTPLIRTLQTFRDPMPRTRLVGEQLERLFPRVYEGEEELFDWTSYLEEALRSEIVYVQMKRGEECMGLNENYRGGRY